MFTLIKIQRNGKEAIKKKSRKETVKGKETKGKEKITCPIERKSLNYPFCIICV